MACGGRDGTVEPPFSNGRARQMTLYLVLLAVGALVGGSLGFRLGRTYERVRRPKSPKKKRS